jgi:hypothetical protein
MAFGLPALKSEGIFSDNNVSIRRSALYLILGCDDAYSVRIVPATDRKILPFSLFQNFIAFLRSD